MTKRDCVIEVLRGGMPPYIPSHGECPMDVTVMGDMLPKSTNDSAANAMAFAEFFDNSVTDVGIGISQKTLSMDKSHHIYEYETGAVWKEQYIPTYNREALRFPVNTPEEAMLFKMPEYNDGKRFNTDELTRNIKRMKENGFFVQGTAMGVWGATYINITRFETILEWMLVEPEAAGYIFEQVSHFSLKSAKTLLECGVDCIFTHSDMGTAISTLFSKDLFLKYIYPWLKSLSELCHSYGAFLHLHSHGHIEGFMDEIVESGVDLINPVGPSDYNDLAMFKEKWGSKISFLGGISTTISEMNESEMRRHVADVINIGRKGGRFFPRTESGIPPMPRDKIMLYLDILKEERMKGYI